MAQRRMRRLPGLAEAFYDPLGSFDNGAFGGPIGGHSDHVHVSDVDPQGMLQAIRLAQSMGLRTTENPYVDHVDPVHVQGSYHYRDFPGLYNGKQLGEAVDVSGSADAMARYYRAVTSANGSALSSPAASQPAPVAAALTSGGIQTGAPAPVAAASPASVQQALPQSRTPQPRIAPARQLPAAVLQAIAILRA